MDVVVVVVVVANMKSVYLVESRILPPGSHPCSLEVVGLLYRLKRVVSHPRWEMVMRVSGGASICCPRIQRRSPRVVDSAGGEEEENTVKETKGIWKTRRRQKQLLPAWWVLETTCRSWGHNSDDDHAMAPGQWPSSHPCGAAFFDRSHILPS